MSMDSNYEFSSEQDAIRALEAEGKRLLGIATSIWRQYLSSYQPKQYVRTGKSERSIKLGKVKKIEEDVLGIELTFQDDLTYHDSIVSSTGKPRGHSIMLISEGWRVKKGRHKGVYRFGYYEGFDYLAKVEEAFNGGKQKGITLEIQWAGEKFKKGKKQPKVLR